MHGRARQPEAEDSRGQAVGADKADRHFHRSGEQRLSQGVTAWGAQRLEQVPGVRQRDRQQRVGGHLGYDASSSRMRVTLRRAMRSTSSRSALATGARGLLAVCGCGGIVHWPTNLLRLPEPYATSAGGWGSSTRARRPARSLALEPPHARHSRLPRLHDQTVPCVVERDERGLGDHQPEQM